MARSGKKTPTTRVDFYNFVEYVYQKYTDQGKVTLGSLNRELSVRLIQDVIKELETVFLLDGKEKLLKIIVSNNQERY